MSSTRASAANRKLAAFGIALPYVVAVLSIAFSRDSIRDNDYYVSGRLTTWDIKTGWMTFGALLLGTILSWPWVLARFRHASFKAGFLVLGAAGLVMHFIAVFALRFLVYLGAGGIL